MEECSRNSSRNRHTHIITISYVHRHIHTPTHMYTHTHTNTPTHILYILTGYPDVSDVGVVLINFHLKKTGNFLYFLKMSISTFDQIETRIYINILRHVTLHLHFSEFSTYLHLHYIMRLLTYKHICIILSI